MIAVTLVDLIGGGIIAAICGGFVIIDTVRAHRNTPQEESE